VDIVIAKYLARMAAHITNELHIYLATQALRIAKHDATAADASHSEPTRLNKNLIFDSITFLQAKGEYLCMPHGIFRILAAHRRAKMYRAIFCIYVCFAKFA
jgi:hypothetical protein